jgi:hypothetical protein
MHNVPAIIRHRGTPQVVVDPRGKKLERVPGFFVKEWRYEYVPCAPYDNHFIYANEIVGQPSYMCTCGSAVVVPRESPRMFVCLFHKTYGTHQGDSKWS